MKDLDWKTCRRIGITLFVLYLAIHYWNGINSFAALIFSAAVPLIAGFATAYIINIIMGFFEKILFPKAEKKFLILLRRPLAVVLSFLILITITTLIVYLIFPQLLLCLRFLIDAIPGLTKKAIAFMEKYPLLSETVLPFLKGFDWQGLANQALSILSSGFSGVMALLTGVVSGAISAFFSLIFSVYLLFAKDRLLNTAHRAAKAYLPQVIHDKLLHVFRLMNQTFRNYIAGQCTEAIILGLLCYIGMLIFRLPFAEMISALIAFTALVPIAGAYIGGGIGFVMILTISPWQALFFVIYLIVLQQLEGNLIYPRVVGSSIGLPGIWVLAAITVGGGVGGIIGMLLGVPLFATVYALLKEQLLIKEKKLQEKAEQDKTETEPSSSPEDL